MNMNTIRLLPALLLLLLLTSCGLLPELEDETKGWSASKFYSEASGAMSEGDYETAIKYYEQLEARYPFGRYAMQAQLDVAYAYYKFDEPESAIAAADRFIKLHPTNPYVDYAYYIKGIVNFNRSIGFFDRFIPIDSSQRDPAASAESFKDFSTLIRKFPNSKYSADARIRIVHLHNNMAKYHVHVARYYMKRGAYLAAANRCKEVIEKYQRSTAVRDALVVMIEAYDALELEDLSNDAQRVLALNDAKGTFQLDEPEEVKPLGRRIWDYLELDKN
jgi:outer membrane protein assembly factor BamD